MNAASVRLFGEDRLFPYLGNAPTIRWPFDSAHRCEVAIGAALREVLRNVHFLEHVKTMKRARLLPDTCVQIGTAPEMLTYTNLLRAKKCDRTKPSGLLYPPPLGDEEIEILEDLNPSNVTFTTPTSIVAHTGLAKNEMPLKGRVIGLSISNSTDLAERGMGLVHLEDAMVECARHSTKNKGGREVAMTARVAELLRLAVAGKKPTDAVLTRKSGAPVRDVRDAWQSICCRAGLGAVVCAKCRAAECPCVRPKRKYSGLIPHDLRRSAAKALRAAGVPESVIMQAGGWKTAAMFRRYAIVSSDDQRAAMEMLERARRTAPGSAPEPPEAATPRVQ